LGWAAAARRNSLLTMPCVLICAMLKWHLHHTAKAFENSGALAGYWVSNANISRVASSRYRRIWPYHLLKKPFYHLPFPNLDEWTRWLLLPAYDVWVRSQKLPDECNVVMGPMGSCLPLFEMADKQDRRILKVFDAPNSHPQTFARLWQDECDRFMPGYKIPFPEWAVERISREIEEADLVLCPSDFVKESMVEHGVEEAKCFVRHFGVDTSIFRPREVAPERPLFVSVASVCLRKGHQYLFPAFRRFKETHPDARLVCVGGLRPDFRREWPKWRDDVEHHPFMHHEGIAALLKTATAFVLASVEEGFARVLSEAMAAGLPVIATHETGITTVAVHGVDAWVIPARDEEAIHQALWRLTEDRGLNESMGKNARMIGNESNTWQDYGDAILARVGEALTR
jgi:glycosyltransferase involved in cell wall biosynthesis